LRRDRDVDFFSQGRTVTCGGTREETFLPGSNGNADYWDLKRNTQVKHDILSSYLLRWASILSGGQEGARRLAFHYVDGFAGRGRYSGGEPGSPLIAMEIGQEMYEHRGGNVRLNCYNVEQDPQNFASLEKEVEEARPRYPSVEVSYFQGPFQEHSDEILRRIPESEDTFVFIDPFGPKGVELDEVMRFLVRRRSEVFITFMSNYIGGFMTDAHKAGLVDAIFATDEWRDLVGLSTTSQQTGAVQLYGKQLQKKGLEMGKELYVLPIDVAFEDRSANQYHLIHVSQHPKGRLAMEESVGKVKRLSTQEALFTLGPEIEQHALEALRANPQGMRALDLAGKVWFRSWYASWPTDIKEAIRTLESTGEAEVRTHNGSSRPRGGLEERDLVVLKGGR
jgi:three-Cys-motif partner protein